jgi:hypothetical protein
MPFLRIRVQGDFAAYSEAGRGTLIKDTQTLRQNTYQSHRQEFREVHVTHPAAKDPDR